jgi:hypothetical protein
MPSQCAALVSVLTSATTGCRRATFGVPAALPAVAAVQGATRLLVAPLSKGCDWGQDVPAMLRQLPGISISSQQRHLAGTLVSIVATKQA